MLSSQIGQELGQAWGQLISRAVPGEDSPEHYSLS